ncbi:LOW QUALITY PROTEIN: interleukin-13 [Mustela nigripes]|uniref:LOW QUALITY PROTEIN: interleukin-13 n=1 Tax=Mustela nigripes TaxID=77151 RepID=UPI002815FE38|nr:LOW QUALITY PROTEIN: interleukin-13 [Mustela nigripes]
MWFLDSTRQSGDQGWRRHLWPIKAAARGQGHKPLSLGQPTSLLLNPPVLAFSPMALWLTVIIAFTCLSGLASPGPVHNLTTTKELIEELANITQNQASLCNGSMVWSINRTTSMYCAALESLTSVSNCSAIHRTQRLLRSLCHQDTSAGQIPSKHSQDTKIEVIQLVKNLLTYARSVFRHGNFP